MKKYQLSFLVASLLCALSTQASIGVSPVHLGIQNGAKSTSLSIINDSDSEAIADVRVKKWVSTKNGTDVLEDTDAVVLSRPVVTIPAHAKATIRLIAKFRVDPDEDRYRVVINDITPAAKDSHVTFHMDSVLPLFVLNSKSGHGYLTLADGTLTNAGNRHIRIGSYTTRDGKKVDKLIYVMPGQSISLPVKSSDDVVSSDDIY